MPPLSGLEEKSSPSYPNLNQLFQRSTLWRAGALWSCYTEGLNNDSEVEAPSTLSTSVLSEEGRQLSWRTGRWGDVSCCSLTTDMVLGISVLLSRRRGSPAGLIVPQWWALSRFGPAGLSNDGVHSFCEEDSLPFTWDLCPQISLENKWDHWPM